MQSPELHDLVYAWHTRNEHGPALLAAFHSHVRRMSARYPDAYFELGSRDDSALASLSHRVFARCDRQPRGPHPFLWREPFRAYTEERLPSRPIRYHTFYAWRSVAREVLRDDYRKSAARDPVLRWKDALYRDLGPILSASADPVPSPDGRAPRWTARGHTPRLARAHAEVVHRLRQLPDRDLKTLVPEALTLLGRPISRSALCHLLAEVLEPPPPGPRQASSPDALELQHDPAPSAQDRLAVRAAVASAWADLEPLDRSLLAGLARGEDTPTLLAADPRLRDPSSLTRAISRVGGVFVAEVLRQVGAAAAPDQAPRALIEPILAVLIELLPELP